MINKITSLQNPLVKQVLKLQEKSRERKRTDLFVVEGRREIHLALANGYKIEKLIFCTDLISIEKTEKIWGGTAIGLIEVSREVYNKLTYRSGTEGIIAIAKKKKHRLEDLRFSSPHPLILVAEAIEKPGNIGALLRTADAANVDAMIITSPTTDLYNSNTIRSAVGCVFTNQIAVANSDAVISFLKEKNIAVYCAALTKNAAVYHTQDYTKPTAIVVGTEATGLTKKWLRNSVQNILIPMSGQIDSLNVSVAAGILIFEAKRQRVVKQSFIKKL